MADSDASSMIYYSPSPGAYAVIRLNPVEMVRHLQDQEALAQARAMRTKTYLIYLHRVRRSYPPPQIDMKVLIRMIPTGDGASLP